MTSNQTPAKVGFTIPTGAATPSLVTWTARTGSNLEFTSQPPQNRKARRANRAKRKRNPDGHGRTR